MRIYHVFVLDRKTPLNSSKTLIVSKYYEKYLMVKITKIPLEKRTMSLDEGRSY